MSYDWEMILDLDFEGVEGLNPDPEKHQFHMLVQVINLYSML